MAIRKKDIKKHHPMHHLGSEQLRQLIAAAESWKCSYCGKTFNKDSQYCPNCKNACLEPVINIPPDEKTCPGCTS